MFIVLYIIPKKINLTIIVQRNGSYFWKANDIVTGICKYTHVKDALKRYLPNEKNEYLRYRDLKLESPVKYNNSLVLTTSQVVDFLRNCSRNEDFRDFADWFWYVEDDKMIPVKKDIYAFALRHPNYDGEVYASTLFDNEPPETFYFTLRDLSFQLRINNEAVPPYRDLVDETPKRCDITLVGFDYDDSKTIDEDCGGNLTIYEDKTKCYDYIDNRTLETYHFAAINLNWNKDRVPINVYPYMKFDDQNAYAYVPIRKTVQENEK